MWVAAGFQNWRRLLFLHWQVAASELRPHVPPSLAIEEFDGSAYVGLVPFEVQAARPLGAPQALGLSFLETNVRTYVQTPDGAPGVYFFSLDATSLTAVVGARVAFGLPYFWATGEQRAVSAGSTEYRLRRYFGRQPGCHVRYAVGEYRGPAAPGTLDHFLIERYILHVVRGGRVWSVRVRHRPYPLHVADVEVLDDQLVDAAGVRTTRQAPLVHFASGVDVAVSLPRVRPVGPA